MKDVKLYRGIGVVAFFWVYTKKEVITLGKDFVSVVPLFPPVFKKHPYIFPEKYKQFLGSRDTHELLYQLLKTDYENKVLIRKK